MALSCRLPMSVVTLLYNKMLLLESPTTLAHYSPEARERTVRVVLDLQKDHPSQRAVIRSMASKIGCSAETLRKWMRRAEHDSGQRCGPTSDDLLLKVLERENLGLRQADGVLRPRRLPFDFRARSLKAVATK